MRVGLESGEASEGDGQGPYLESSNGYTAAFMGESLTDCEL